MTMDADCIVLGGGVAGLAAAQHLCDHDKKVILLEARDRLGGRILTHHAPDLPVALELGAEWLSAGGEVRRFLKRHDVTLTEALGDRWRRGAEGWSRLDTPADTFEPLIERLHPPDGGDRSLRLALRTSGGDPRWADQARQLLEYVEGFHAADPDRLSVRWLVEVEAEQSADDSQLRSTEGLDLLVRALTPAEGGPCEVRYGTVVREVRWTSGQVTVLAQHGTEEVRCTAPTAIVTLPAAILALRSGEGSVRFTPALTSRRDALDRMVTGDVVKVAMVFRRPFWHAIEGVPDLGVLQAPGTAFPVWWTTLPVASPVLLGWAGGPGATALPTGEALRDLALDALADALALPRAVIDDEFLAWHHHDWRRDPFARGGYTYVAEGGLDAPATLARPVAQTLFFAGEATAGGGYNATVEGAMQSGWRAAREVLAR